MMSDEKMTIGEMDKATYGKADDIAAAGTVLAIPIDQIRIDKKQPRRVLPSEVRFLLPEYAAEPGNALATWNQVANARLTYKINVAEGIMSYCKGANWEAPTIDDPVVERWFDLMALAASIQRDGLTNPVTVMRHNSTIFLLQTGERRYWAHQLLHLHKFETGAAINARIVDKTDVWGQAAENGNRKSLNAIGMARQVAILIMDLYAMEKDVMFYDIDDPVWGGGCDRAFYAQVANGGSYSVPHGQGRRMLNVTGLKTLNHLGRYRKLLTLDDDIWEMADDENWAEGRIRDYVSPVSHPLDDPAPEADESDQVPVPDQTIGGAWGGDSDYGLSDDEVDLINPDYGVSQDEVDIMNDAMGVGATDGLDVDETPSSSHVADDPLVESEQNSPIEEKKIIDEYPPELKSMLEFLRASADRLGDEVSKARLDWLMSLTESSMVEVIKNNGNNWFSGWLGQTDDLIESLLADLKDNFSEMMGGMIEGLIEEAEGE